MKVIPKLLPKMLQRRDSEEKAQPSKVPTEEKVLEGLQVPEPLWDRPQHRRLARSIVAAYGAVAHLQKAQPNHGGKNAEGQICDAPLISSFDLSQFLLNELRYAERPLRRADEWVELLTSRWFGDHELGAALTKQGFSREALRQIWSAPPEPADEDGAKASAKKRAARGPRGDDERGDPHDWSEYAGLSAHLWELLSVHPKLWQHRTIGELAGVIYDHEYLGEPLASSSMGPTPAAPPGYTAKIQEVFTTHKRTMTPGDGFFHTGSASGVRFRIYLHAKRDTAPDVLGHALRKMQLEPTVVYVKVADSATAGTRPDTVVVYVASEREEAQRIAHELRDAVGPEALAPSTPAMTHQICSGIGMGWNPQATTDLSFGGYMSAILAEAFFDLMGSTSAETSAKTEAPGAAALHRHTVDFLELYGLSPDPLQPPRADARMHQPPSKVEGSKEEEQAEAEDEQAYVGEEEEAEEAEAVAATTQAPWVPARSLKLIPEAAASQPSRRVPPPIPLRAVKPVHHAPPLATHPVPLLHPQAMSAAASPPHREPPPVARRPQPTERASSSSVPTRHPPARPPRSAITLAPGRPHEGRRRDGEGPSTPSSSRGARSFLPASAIPLPGLTEESSLPSPGKPRPVEK